MRKLFMTSVALATMAISMALFQMTSCKKAEAQPSGTSRIEGLWIGTYAIEGQPELGKQYFSLIIKPDGTMISDTKFADQQHLSIGNWQMTGVTLNCSFTCVYGIPQNIGITETSTANLNNGKLEGTWSNVPPLTGTGAISLTKVN
jgi:hypothetical protein